MPNYITNEDIVNINFPGTPGYFSLMTPEKNPKYKCYETNFYNISEDVKTIFKNADNFSIKMHGAIKGNEIVILPKGVSIKASTYIGAVYGVTSTDEAYYNLGIKLKEKFVSLNDKHIKFINDSLPKFNEFKKISDKRDEILHKHNEILIPKHQKLIDNYYKNKTKINHNLFKSCKKEIDELGKELEKYEKIIAKNNIEATKLNKEIKKRESKIKENNASFKEELLFLTDLDKNMKNETPTMRLAKSYPVNYNHLINNEEKYNEYSLFPNVHIGTGTAMEKYELISDNSLVIRIMDRNVKWKYTDIIMNDVKSLYLKDILDKLYSYNKKFTLLLNICLSLKQKWDFGNCMNLLPLPSKNYKILQTLHEGGKYIFDEDKKRNSVMRHHGKIDKQLMSINFKEFSENFVRFFDNEQYTNRTSWFSIMYNFMKNYDPNKVQVINKTSKSNITYKNMLLPCLILILNTYTECVHFYNLNKALENSKLFCRELELETYNSRENSNIYDTNCELVLMLKDLKIVKETQVNDTYKNFVKNNLNKGTLEERIKLFLDKKRVLSI